MQCRYCGAYNDPDKKNCVLCGKVITAPTAAGGSDADPPPTPAVAPDPVPVRLGRQLTQEEHIRIGELIYSAYKHKESGAIEDAIAACQGALALNESSAPAHTLLASLYESKGEIPSAIYEYEKVQALDPGNVANRQKLDILRTTSGIIGDSAGKPKFSARLDELAPHMPWILSGLAFVVVASMLWVAWGRSSNRAGLEAQRTAQSGLNNPQRTMPVQPNGGSLYPQTQGQTQGQPYLGPGQVQTPAGQTTQTPGQPVTNEQRTGPVQVPVPKSGVVTGERTVTTAPLPTVSAPKPTPQPTPVITPNPEPPKMVIVTQPKPKPAPQNADPEARAMQLQGERKYSEAVTAYREALTRTSDSGRIYQQIASCYKSLGQKDNAVSNYKSAIRSYRDQLAGGRDAAEVQRNIRSCEAAIEVLQVR